MRKLRLMLFGMILLASSSGCLASKQTDPLLPVRPYLDVQVQDDGGIRLDKGDTEKLMLYLLELERRY